MASPIVDSAFQCLRMCICVGVSGGTGKEIREETTRRGEMPSRKVWRLIGHVWHQSRKEAVRSGRA